MDLDNRFSWKAVRSTGEQLRRQEGAEKKRLIRKKAHKKDQGKEVNCGPPTQLSLEAELKAFRKRRQKSGIGEGKKLDEINCSGKSLKDQIKQLQSIRDAQRKKKADQDERKRFVDGQKKSRRQFFRVGFQKVKGWQWKALKLWRYKTVIVSRFLSSESKKTVKKGKTSCPKSGNSRNIYLINLKHEIDVSFDKMGVLKKQKASELLHLLSTLRKQFSVASEKVSGISDPTTVLESLYGRQSYHIANQEAYDHVYDRSLYKPLTDLLGDQPSSILQNNGCDDTLNVLNDVLNNVCEHCRCTNKVLSDLEHFKLDEESDSSKKCSSELLGRFCDSGCQLPKNWSIRLHNVLEVLIKENILLTECSKILVELECCQYCSKDHYPYCPKGEQCEDLIKLLRKVQPHYVGVRTMLRKIYRMRQINFWLISLDGAIVDADFEKFKSLLMEGLKVDNTINMDSDCLPITGIDEFISKRFFEVWAKFKHDCYDFPNLVCNSCNMWFLKSKGGQVCNSWDKIPGNCTPLLEDLQNNCQLPINLCRRCREDLKAGRVPALSKFNNMGLADIPKELARLNTFETILIQLSKTFQTIFRLRPLTQSGCGADLVQAVRGLAVHLPLPLEATRTYVQQTLPSLNNMEIMVDSCPTKRNVVWRELVNLLYVKEALVKLKENNWLYKDVKIDMNNPEVLDNEQITILQTTKDGSLLKDSTASSMLKVNRDCDEYANVTIEPIYSGKEKEKSDLEIYRTKRVSTSEPIGHRDPQMDVKCFPVEFPTGEGGMFSERNTSVKPPMYLKHRLMNQDGRFRQNAQYIFAELARYNDRTVEQGIYATMNTGRRSDLTAGEIKKQIEDKSQVLEAKLSMLFSKQRGTPEYWRSINGDLQAMDETLGPATFFITLSAAEYEWEDMRAYQEFMNCDIENVKLMRSSWLCSRDPVSTSLQFQRRFEAMLKDVLLKEVGPIGKVTHYFARLEYQARGAPHIHMKVWVEGAPIIGINTPKEITDFIDGHVTCSVPSQHSDPDLHNLVTRYQKHKCGSCLRKKHPRMPAVCRFSFPKPVTKETVLHSVEDGIRSRKTGGKLVKLYDLKRGASERDINDYNPALLAMWRANMDIQYVGENSLLLNRYITSYMTKSEKNRTEELWSAIDENKTLWSRLRSYTRIMMQKRETGAYEAIDKLLGHKLYYASIDVKFVNTNYQSERSGRVLTYKQLQELPEDSKKIFCRNAINDYYPSRPDLMSDVCLHEFSAWYEPEPGKIVAESESRFLLKNDYGMVRKRTKPVIIKTPYTNTKTDDGIEKYYHMLLMLFKPWRKEEELLGNCTSYKEAFFSCLAGYPQMAEFDKRKQNLLHNVELCKVIEQEADVEMQVEDELVFVDLDQDLNSNPNVKTIILPDAQIVGQKVASLNSDQRTIFEAIVAMIKMQETDSNTSQLNLIVSGVAGTGKSFLIEVLTDKLTLLYGSTSFESVAVVAPTGIAAFNVSGLTVHKFFKLPVQHGSDPEYWKLAEDNRKLFNEQWRHLKLIIIDEFSMISNTMLAMIDRRLSECLSFNKPFGGKNIILFGDFLQLAPVNSEFCFERVSLAKTKQIFNAVSSFDLWELFSYSELTINMRQSEDLAYAQMLSRIRLGSPTEADIDQLKTRLVGPGNVSVSTKEAVQIFCSNILQLDEPTVCLCPMNREVDEFNQLMLIEEKINVLTIPAIDTRLNVKQTKPKLQRVKSKVTNDTKKAKKASDTAGLEENLQVGERARIMLRRNIDTSKGLVNGALGRILQIIQQNGIAKVLLIKFDNISEVVGLERCNASFEVAKNITMERSQFPICLAYAITIHKSQGLTLNKAMINIGKSCFEDAMAYVALSRVKSLRNVHLIDFDPSVIRCKKVAVAEYSRLRSTVNLPQLPEWNKIPVKYRKIQTSKLQISANVQVTAPGVIKSKINEQLGKKIDTNPLNNPFELLNNDGTSCYANSVVQCLLRMPALLANLTSMNQKNAVVEELLRLNWCKENNLSHQTTIKLRALVGNEYALPEQQDVHLFFLGLLNHLGESSIDLFRLSEVRSTTCMVNESHHRVFPPTMNCAMYPTIAVSQEFNSLIHSIKTEVENCPGCNVQRALKEQITYTFGADSRYLMIYLNLFDPHTLARINRTITKFNANQITISGRRYKAISAILHWGHAITEGHYACWIRTEDDFWINLNDLKIGCFSRRKRFIDNLKNVYLLFLERI